MRTHCCNGHEQTAQNVRVEPSGKRVCRACARANARRHYVSRAGEKCDRCRQRDTVLQDVGECAQRICRSCVRDDRDAMERENDPHERAAARARSNDFEDTDGYDWT